MDPNSCTYLAPDIYWNYGCFYDSDNDGFCDVSDGCNDQNACNWNGEGDPWLGCIYAVPNYLCNGQCAVDVDADGVCDFQDPCYDVNACNYNNVYSEYGCLYGDSDADGLCDGLDGCSDVTACNYNSLELWYGCFYDLDNDGVCDNVDPCNDPIACNWNGATEGCYYPGVPCGGQGVNAAYAFYDENCTCISYTLGCMNSTACNYSADADIDDGSCLFQNTPCNDNNPFTINDVLNATCNCQGTLVSGETVTVGQSYQGGVVVRVVQPGEGGFDPAVPHGLIAATADQGSYTWSNAVQLFWDFNLNGYTGWRLPDVNELALLYGQRQLLGTYQTSWNYWSSSEISSTLAWALNFSNGSSYQAFKGFSGYVRAVRSF